MRIRFKTTKIKSQCGEDTGIYDPCLALKIWLFELPDCLTVELHAHKTVKSNNKFWKE